MTAAVQSDPSIEAVFRILGAARDAFVPQLACREIGTVTHVSTGFAVVTGLPGIGFEELIQFPGDLLGIAFNIDTAEIGVILLGDYQAISAGDEVTRTGRVMDVAVGDALLGRVIDPLGRPLDGKDLVEGTARRPVECPAPAIMDRAAVVVPLQTGLKVIDAMIPIGRGQRELILGDRQTGKTAVAIDTILNQRDQNVLCVYCAIGQRAAAVAQVIAKLRDHGALAYCVVLVAEGNEAPGLSYVAPYAATSIAESFMADGRDVLIVYDDLTHHARSYRELSLLLRRPPGREAFPGDIFYIHSRLLERATHLSSEHGGGSLTALPIIETEAQDLAAYIPTNLISITDGQIYLSPTLFELGSLPAVDVAQSVSRVGGAAQRGAYRAVAGDLKLSYSQFEELETFARFGTRMDDATRHTIEHGRRIRECLKQAESRPLSLAEQILVLLALAKGLFDPIAIEQVAEAEKALRLLAHEIPAEVALRFNSAKTLSESDRQVMLDIATRGLQAFKTAASPPGAGAVAVATEGSQPSRKAASPPSGAGGVAA